MDNLFIFLVSFVGMFLIYFIMFYLYGLKKKKIKNSMQVEFILIRSGLKKKEVSEKSIGIIICLIDPLIISVSGTIATSLNLNYIWQILIGFAMLIGLIFGFYEIIAKILKRKCRK